MCCTCSIEVQVVSTSNGITIDKSNDFRLLKIKMRYVAIGILIKGRLKMTENSTFKTFIQYIQRPYCIFD